VDFFFFRCASLSWLSKTEGLICGLVNPATVSNLYIAAFAVLMMCGILRNWFFFPILGKALPWGFV
jgi:hypothetical protein